MFPRVTNSFEMSSKWNLLKNWMMKVMKTKKKKDEDAWEPGDWDDDYDADDAIHAKAAPNESAARVDDAIQEAVKASLETAAKELKV